MNLEKQNLMNFKEKEKEKSQKYSIKSDGWYHETIKNLESTNFGIHKKSHRLHSTNDFIHQIYNIRSKQFWMN